METLEKIVKISSKTLCYLGATYLLLEAASSAAPSDEIIRPELQQHVGDAILAIPNAFGGIVKNVFTELKLRRYNLLYKITEKFPEISTLALSTYITLGELGMNILPSTQTYSNTPDLKDIPAGILMCLFTYKIAKDTVVKEIGK